MNGYFNTRSALSVAGLATALPQQGAPVYFRKPANLRRWQAALAKQRAGTYRPRVAFIGDSKDYGYGAGTSSGNTWSDGAEPRSKIAHVVRLLNASGIPASRQSTFGTGGSATVAIKQAYDARLSEMSAWGGGPISFGGPMWQLSSTAAGGQRGTFTPEGSVDSFDVFWRISAGLAPIKVTIDGTATVVDTLVTAGAAGFGKKTISAGSLGAHTINLYRDVAPAPHLIGIIARNSTVPAIDILNGGVPGVTALFHTSTNGTWATANALATLACDLVIIQLGSNDLNTGVSVETYTANMQDIVTKAKVAGADVVLEVPTFGNAGGYGTDAQREIFRQALIGLGATNGCIVVDHAARFGTWAQANALGLMKDAIHETEPGYADEALALVSALVF